MPAGHDPGRGSTSLEVFVNTEAHPTAPKDLVELAVRHALAETGGAVGEISITLLADPDMSELNRLYLDRDRPTDVIAFSLGEEDRVLGDVYIGVDQARRQADEHGIDLAEELVRLAIHGTLHLMGHEHPGGEERSASPMFVLQERLVNELMGEGKSR